MTLELIWPGKGEAISLLSEKYESDETIFRERHNSLVLADNINALKLLVKNNIQFHFIYIDPPYNSGSRLTYKDKNKDSAEWVNMIYPRLLLAHKVQREDGIIFVSIDEREYSSLCQLMREIWGKENHLGTLKWRKKRKASFLDRHISSVIEYILVFAKDYTQAPSLSDASVRFESTRPVLNASNQTSTRFLRAGTEARCKDGLYKKGIYVNRSLELELLQDTLIQDGRLFHDTQVSGRFRVSQEVLDNSVYITPRFGLRRYVDQISNRKISDLCTGWPTNEDGEQELREIFGKRVFDFPKPVGLIENLLKACKFKSDGPLYCLDFFAGSGTFAEAVLKTNQLDGIERYFYCIQNNEKLNSPIDGLETMGDIIEKRIRHATSRYNATTPLQQITLKNSL